MNDLSLTEQYKVPERGTFNFKKIPLEDPTVWASFARANTTGIFQCESKLGKEWCKKIKPRSIKELADVISAVRPGPLESGMSDSYVKRKNGDEDTTTGINSVLDEILKDTYACLFYQEQSIKIAQQIAGYTEEGADSLRKSLGKKLPEEVAKQKILFLEGSKTKGLVSVEDAEKIFSWIEKGQRYLFNLSHAASYALTSYYCMYQKVHFPTEFYCSWLTFSNDKPDPQEEKFNLIQDAKINNISILPPIASRKNKDFEIIKDKEIIFGLSNIRGIGESAIENIVNVNLGNFTEMLKNIKKIKRHIAESLIKAGACDSYNLSRTYMLKVITAIFGRKIDKSLEEEQPDQYKTLTGKELPVFLQNVENGPVAALRAIISQKGCMAKRIPVIEAKIKWLEQPMPIDSARSKAIYEKLYLGVNLTASATQDYSVTEKNLKTCKDIYSLPNKSDFTTYVVIDEIQYKVTGPKSKVPGSEYAFIKVSDNTISLSMVLWHETFLKYKEDLIEDSVVVIFGKKDNWQNRDNYIINKLQVIS